MQKIPLIGEKNETVRMLVDAAAHASGASKRLISPSYLLRWQSEKNTKYGQ